MGNVSSLLDGSYEIEEVFPELTSDGHGSKEGQSPGWSLQLAEDSDGRRVSIFLYPAGKDATNVGYVDNAVKVHLTVAVLCTETKTNLVS